MQERFAYILQKECLLGHTLWEELKTHKLLKINGLMHDKSFFKKADKIFYPEVDREGRLVAGRVAREIC